MANEEDIDFGEISEALNDKADRDFHNIEEDASVPYDIAQLGIETQLRINGDNHLQEQIDALVSKQELADIVGTYADLQAYDKTKLNNNDIIEVLQDERHDGAVSYYKYSTSTQSFSYIGSTAASYTKEESDERYAHLTGNETISGTKTFNTTPIVGTASSSDNSTKAASTAFVQTAISNKVTKNSDITGSTKCKITYDSKGLVTAGADLQASDIPSLTLSKLSDVTASASELNVLDGITASTSELNYTDGVTSNIQTQLDSKAVDTGVVHIAGTEEITGTKSFEATLQLKNNLSFRSYGSNDSGRLQFRAQPSDNVIRGTVAITDGYSTTGSGYTGFVAQMVARAGSTTSEPFNTMRVSNKGIEYIKEANDGTITGQYILIGSDGIIPQARLASGGTNGQVLTTNGTSASWATITIPQYTSGTGISLNGTVINHSNSITAGTAGTSSATSGSTLDVPYVTYDAQGHITASGTHTHTVTGFLTSSDIDQTYSGTSTNAQSGKAVKSAIDAAISSVYKPAGSIAFSGLPTLSSSVLGNVYNINESFTTTADFVEGAGKSYPAGTNVVVIDIGTSSSHSYKFDVLAGFVDLSGYQLSNTAVKHTASTSVGNSTTPVYVDSNGNATALNYTIAKSVPSNAVFTDTTYSAFTGASSGSAGSSGLVPAPAAGDQNKVLTGSGTWIETSSTDTLNTAGATDTSSKIFLVGATTQGANPQTYTHDTVFVDTNGRLNSAAPASSANDTTVATTKWVKDQSYVSGNASITGATKCKITYDSKGLVTAGADLSASDIPNLTLSKITDVTATATEVNVLDGITASTSELNILDGATLTTTELNYVDGVTSSIQTQLNNKATDSSVVHKTGAETVAGVKTFSDNMNANGTITVGQHTTLSYNSSTEALDFIFT